MSKHHDDFGDRIKEYEANETSRVFDPTLPVVVRIDGRSFSKFTKGMRRPYDSSMSDCMIATTKTLVEDTHARIGYTQSDEISLVFLAGEGSQLPFGGKIHKLTSVLASLAGSAFMYALYRRMMDPKLSQMPHFDARVFQVPSKEEATNALLWRAMDARKNSVSMACRSVRSSKQMHGADQTRMRDMLLEDGIDFEDYPAFFKWGTWVRRVTKERMLTPREIERIPEEHRPEPSTLVIRSSIEEIDMPEFRLVKNRADVIFDGCDPETE
jgi:tRNA(His) guanylyltransferase